MYLRWAYWTLFHEIGPLFLDAYQFVLQLIISEALKGIGLLGELTIVVWHGPVELADQTHYLM
jgi:hypothetical protein